tara:strand:+ start:32773 stop:34374 length:1602 start_codon:yes stop_codon:yes gene_type:complete
MSEKIVKSEKEKGKSDSKRCEQPQTEKLERQRQSRHLGIKACPEQSRRVKSDSKRSEQPRSKELLSENSPLIRGAGGCPRRTFHHQSHLNVISIIAIAIILLVPQIQHAQNTPSQFDTPLHLSPQETEQALFGDNLYPELQQYLRMAIEQNPELQSMQAMVEADRERVREAGVLMDPEINIAYDFNPMMSESQLGRFSISAMQMFPWFGSLDAKRDFQQAAADANRSRVTSRQLEILRDLQIYWLDIAKIGEQIRITRENVELVMELEKLVEIRYETGRAGQADILRIQMEEQRLLNQIANLQDSLNPIKARFNELLNRETSADVMIADELNSRPMPYTQEEIQSFILQQHPQFDLITAERSAAGQQLRLAKLDGRPSFGIGLEVMGSDFGPMSMFPDARESIIVMAVVRVPLFRSRYDSQKKQANFRLQSLDHQQDVVENRLMTSLEEMLEEVRSAERSFILLDEELVPRARQALTIMSEEYSTGAIRFDELLQIQRELLALEYERIETVINQNKAIANIESLIGGYSFIKK